MPRYLITALSILFFPLTSAHAQVSVNIDLPGVSIGINQPVFPELVRVPGYPVYYAPRVQSNYFFYDGMYWVYQGDNWYASSWYNGPWSLVDPDSVPLYVLRIPVRYYRSPPPYFRGWRADAPPRWSQHWGNAWAQQRSGWDNWNHRAAPAPAPLPVYQRQYSGNRYPRIEQQQALQGQNYHYRPRDSATHQPPVRTAPAPVQRAQAQQDQQQVQRQQQAQHEQQVQQQGAAQRGQQHVQQQQQNAVQHEQQVQRQQQGAAQREQQQAQRQQQNAAQHEQQVQRQQQGAAQREQQQAQRQQQNAAQHEQQVQQQQGAAQRQQQVQRQQQSAPQPEQARPNPQNIRENKGTPQEPVQGRGQGQEREKGGDRGGDRGQERDK